MKKVNPKATWVVQGWTENPRPEMIKEYAEWRSADTGPVQ